MEFRLVLPITSDEVIQLTKLTGMTILNQNGQRLFGIPEELDENMHNNNNKTPGSEVFCQVPRYVCEVELFPIFSKIGKIRLIRTMMDFSGTNRGYCYIRYETEDEAKRAVNQLNKYEIAPGFRMHVKTSFDNCRLHIMVPNTSQKSSEEIFEQMRSVSQDAVPISLEILQPDAENERNLNFIAEYNSHRLAAIARREMLMRSNVLFGQIPEVNWNTGGSPSSKFRIQQLRTLYIGGLTDNVNENTIKNVIGNRVNAGNTISINMDDVQIRRIRDFAFVEFPTHNAADVALQSLTNSVVDNNVLKVSWARQRPYNRQYRNNYQQMFSHNPYHYNSNWTHSGHGVIPFHMQQQQSYRGNYDPRYFVPQNNNWGEYRGQDQNLYQ